MKVKTQMIMLAIIALSLFFMSGFYKRTNLKTISAFNKAVDKTDPTFDFYAKEIYQSLNDSTLNFCAFECALKGYVILKDENKLKNDRFLTVIDFSKSANEERFYLIDIKDQKIIHKSMVAHGRNSGDVFANTFSNATNSYQSSLGFFVTGETYTGKHGLSLRLDGLESCNSNARMRAVVIHSAEYVSNFFIKAYGRIGRSFGCPALPVEFYPEIVEKIKDGSCIFAYHPNEQYLKSSSYINTEKPANLVKYISAIR